VRLVEHLRALREQIGETDGDEFAVLGRRLLNLGKEDGQDLSKEATPSEVRQSSAEGSE
jgi:hypothetical protein